MNEKTEHYAPSDPEWLKERLAIADDSMVGAPPRPCDKYPGCNANNCLGCGEVAASPSSKSTAEVSVSLEQVEELANVMWKDEPVPGRVLRFGAAVLGLADAALALASSSTKEDGGGGEPIPSALFDGAAVYHALSPRARLRTSPENVADVLDAVVHVMKRELSSPPSPLGDTPEQQEQKR